MSIHSDKENAVKSEQAASLLVQDLKDLVKTEDPMLHLVAVQALHDAIMLQRRLLAVTEAIQAREASRV